MVLIQMSVCRPGSRVSEERSIDVSPCDLTEGLWYMAVDAIGGAAAYVMTAVVEEARLVLGQNVEDSVCCLQSLFFVLEVAEWVKGNELVMKLVSDNRLRNQVCLVHIKRCKLCGHSVVECCVLFVESECAGCCRWGAA